MSSYEIEYGEEENEMLTLYWECQLNSPSVRQFPLSADAAERVHVYGLVCAHAGGSSV
jgi:hypothetical protein